MKTKSIGKKLYAAVFLCMLAVTACTDMFHDGLRETPDSPVPQVEAGDRPAITIVYTSGASGKMEQNINNEWEVTPAYTKRDEVIYSFTTVNYEAGGIAGQTYYMGRKDTDATPIKLNISTTGALDFRAPDPAHNNFIPVGTVAEMQLINTDAASLDGKYYQEADIDLLGDFTGPLVKLKWAPIGKADPPNNTANDPFTGVFDGGGNSLDYLYVNEASPGAGLFGHLYGSAVLQNIRLLEHSSVTNTRGDTGGIAGGQWDSTASIRVINCSNGARVTSTASDANSTGGIIGWPMNGAVIAGCRNSGDVSGAIFVGGIAGGGGFAFTVTGCYNLGTIISSNKIVGGIVGEQQGSSTIACYNDGRVTGNLNKGGIKGRGVAPVTACYWNSAAAGTISPPSPDGATDYNGSGSFPNVKDADPEWRTGGGAAWDGTGTPPVGGWWQQTTLTGGQLPKLWWE